MPFLENVTRGRGVPPRAAAEVAEHYQHFGGVSPINEQYRDLLAAIRADFAAHGLDLPVYWGNRNWAPMLADTVAHDARRRRRPGAGLRRPARTAATRRAGSTTTTSPRARAPVGADAPVIDKLRHYYDHPGFVEPHADAVRAALGTLDPAGGDAPGWFSPPTASRRRWRTTAGPRRRPVRARSCTRPAALVAAAAAPDLPWDLVWQSRSGPPQVPWLEPDINDHLAALADRAVTAGGGQPDRVRLRPPRGGVGPGQRGRRRRPSSSASTSSGPPRRAPTPASWRWCASWSPSGVADGAHRAPAGYASRPGTPAPPTAARRPVPGRPSRIIMHERKAIESWLTDMDGVLVHEGQPVPGAPEFINRMRATGKPFLVLTNNSIYTPRDLQARLSRMGLRVPGGVDLDGGPGHRPVPRRPAPGRHGVRHRRGRPDHGDARGRLRAVRLRARTTWCWARPAPTASRPSPRRSA